MTEWIRIPQARALGDVDAAAEYFTKGYEVFTRPPFYTWHEGNDTDGSAGQGAPNLVTAAGGCERAPDADFTSRFFGPS